MQFRVYDKERRTKMLKLFSSSDDNHRKKVEFSSHFVPEDVLLQILHKLPVKSLIKFSCVSKVWFNLIIKDQQFYKFHFLESQKRPILIFTIGTEINQKSAISGPYLQAYPWDQKREPNKNTKDVYYFEKQHGCLQKITTLENAGNKLNVGHSNSLVCYVRAINFRSCYQSYSGRRSYFSLEICNPSRLEKLIIVTRIENYYAVFGFQFGYNILNNEYKMMCITIDKDVDVFEYLIYTVGSTQPWRKIKNPWPKQRPITDKCACPHICCNGILFYCMMIKEKNMVEEIRVLVSFDLSDEQFHKIKLPSEEFARDFNGDKFYHFEYKGCFCCASMERIDLCNSKVDLHILKDTVEHVWVKETINFRLSTELGCTTGSRIMCYSDQVILYWKMAGKKNTCSIRLYNVHTKEFSKVIELPNKVGDIYFHCSSHTENLLSLKTFATTSTINGYTRHALIREHKKQFPSLDSIPGLFKETPPNNLAVVSCYDSLNSVGEIFV